MASEHQTGGHRSADDLVVGLTGARFGGAAGRRSRAAAQSPAEQDTVATRRHRAAQPLVGQTGARFSAGLTRWRRRSPDIGRPASGLTTPDEPAITHGARPAPQSTPVAAQPSENGPSCDSAAEWVDWSDGQAGKETDGLVRPYFWTGGRTAPRFELSFETLVSATGQPIDQAAPPEHRTIVTLCRAPRSVAELAALVSIPLGAARVVLGDLAAAGSLTVHRTVATSDAFPDLDLMQRVLNGLQRL